MLTLTSKVLMENHMEFLYLLISPSYLLFTISIGIALVLGLISLIGGELDEDFDMEVDDNPLMDYLGFGRVPVLVSLMCLIAFFGLSGFGIQFLTSVIGFTLPWYLVAPFALVSSSIITRNVTRFIGKNLPNVETYVSELTDFVGSKAIVTIPAPIGSIGEGRVTDTLGTTHYVRIRFSGMVNTGELVDLVDYDENQRVFLS